MPQGINCCTFGGNLTRDMKLRQTKAGTAIADCSIAVTNETKKGDQWVEEPVFIDFHVWGRRAEALTQHCLKGTPVAITGYMIPNSYTNKDGVQVEKLKLNATGIQFFGKRKDSFDRHQSEQGSNYQQQQQQPAYSQPQGGSDDIPF